MKDENNIKIEISVTEASYLLDMINRARIQELPELNNNAIAAYHDIEDKINMAIHDAILIV